MQVVVIENNAVLEWAMAGSADCYKGLPQVEESASASGFGQGM